MILEVIANNPLWRVKRCFDVLFASTALLAASPLFVILAVLIVSDSSGPVFYCQKRVGRHKNLYLMYKFRTMYHVPSGDRPQFAGIDDPRVTKIGGFLRAHRLDELPQFWNVLKGEMSLIGPRPEQVRLSEELESKINNYGLRTFVRPGITGLSQVNIGYTSDVKSSKIKLQYDLEYILNLNMALELKVFLKTFPTVLSGNGAR